MKNTDPTPKARQLLRKLRGLAVDDELPITMADVALLDRGLCALIDCWARGKDDRKTFERMERAAAE